MNETTLNMLKRLTEAHGVGGYENDIADIMADELKDIGPISYDKLGSIICTKQSTSATPKIMIPAHMDEIGFIVKLITNEGFIKCTMLGGWLPQQLPGQSMIVKTHKGNLLGVFGSRPPHHLTAEERQKPMTMKDLYIDIGAKDKKDAERMGVRPGDPITPKTELVQLTNPEYLLAKAWDDRVSCAVFIEVLRNLKNKKHPNTVYGVGTVQEEIGVRGAKTSVNVINPDIALICDVSLAEDVPGGEAKGQVALNKGPVINLYDAGMIPHPPLRQFVVEVAQKEKIPFQFELDEGSATDAAVIHVHDQGVPAICIGVPTRYIHSHAGILTKTDFDNTVKLITALVIRLDEKKVRSFSR
jgi:putative aminopeptidase FrvX